MASMATKRVKRLERNELTDLPAYQAYEKGGKVAFSVRGKDYNQLQSEYWRLKNFIDAKTSTVRQANKFLREMAENTGLKYNGLADLKSKTKKFFELAAKVKQYYQASERSALALDYQKIWEQINVQLKQGSIDIGGEQDNEAILNRFIIELDKVQPVEDKSEGFKEAGKDWNFIKI